MLRVNQLAGFGVIPPEPFGVTLTETRLAASSVVSDLTTFSAVDAGIPDINRYLAAVLNMRTDSGTFAATIGGVAAFIPVSAVRTVTSPDIRSLILYARVPDGNLVDVVLDWPVIGFGASLTLYRVINPDNMEFDISSGQATTTINTTINVAQGGALICGVCANQDDTATLTGVTKDFQGIAVNWNHTAGSASGLSAQTNRSLNVTGGSTERTLVGLSISPKS